LRSFFNVIIPIEYLLNPEEYLITDSSESDEDNDDDENYEDVFLKNDDEENEDS